jgi:hypothetical protein
LSPPMRAVVFSPRAGATGGRTDPVSVAMRAPRRLLEPIDYRAPAASNRVAA